MKHSAIVRGLANVLWWIVWADVAKKIGQLPWQIDQTAPETPEIAYRWAYQYLGAIEGYNGHSWPVIVGAAWRSDGGEDPECWSEVFALPEYTERLGECFAYMIQGCGVSWEDSHETIMLPGYPRTPLEMPFHGCADQHVQDLEIAAVESFGLTPDEYFALDAED